MKDINAYLTFNGNCRDAMEFYKKCLGADLHMMPFAEGKFEYPKEAKDRIMHAKITHGTATLMASDSMPGQPFKEGTNFSVSINCESAQEVDKLCKAFSEKGKITMPVADTFWNARFGMCTDKFGVNWMFNYDKTAK